MAAESPLKKAIDEAAGQVEKLHQEYQKYFLGVEKAPPLAMRRTLDQLVSKVKSELAKSSSTPQKFAGTTFVSKYQSYSTQWDRTMREIENGSYRRPIRK